MTLPLLSAAFTAQEPQQVPCSPAFASERPQSEASRRLQTGKRLARDAGAILGERVVLCMRDDDELLGYVSRGREARQRQRLAKVDQATERERRVALAHRQVNPTPNPTPDPNPTLPTYAAPLLPRSCTPYVGCVSPSQAAVRFVRSRLGRAPRRRG